MWFTREKMLCNYQSARPAKMGPQFPGMKHRGITLVGGQSCPPEEEDTGEEHVPSEMGWHQLQLTADLE